MTYSIGDYTTRGPQYDDDDAVFERVRSRCQGSHESLREAYENFRVDWRQACDAEGGHGFEWPGEYDIKLGLEKWG